MGIIREREREERRRFTHSIHTRWEEGVEEEEEEEEEM